MKSYEQAVTQAGSTIIKFAEPGWKLIAVSEGLAYWQRERAKPDVTQEVLDVVKGNVIDGGIGQVRALVNRKMNDVARAVRTLLEDGRIKNVGTASRPRYVADPLAVPVP